MWHYLSKEKFISELWKIRSISIQWYIFWFREFLNASFKSFTEVVLAIRLNTCVISQRLWFGKSTIAMAHLNTEKVDGSRSVAEVPNACPQDECFFFCPSFSSLQGPWPGAQSVMGVGLGTSSQAQVFHYMLHASFDILSSVGM